MSSLVTVLLLMGFAWWFGYRWGQESERIEQTLRDEQVTRG